MGEERMHFEEEKNALMRMIDEIKSERKQFDKQFESFKKEREEMSVKKEFEKIANGFVKKNEVNDFISVPYTNLISKELKQLEEWTKLKCHQVIFDSDIDEWNDRKVFYERILGKKQLLLIVEDEDGNKFGGFVNAELFSMISEMTF